MLVDVGVSRVYDEEAGRYRIKGDVDRGPATTRPPPTPPNPGAWVP